MTIALVRWASSGGCTLRSLGVRATLGMLFGRRLQLDIGGAVRTLGLPCVERLYFGRLYIRAAQRASVCSVLSKPVGLTESCHIGVCFRRLASDSFCMYVSLLCLLHCCAWFQITKANVFAWFYNS